MAEMWDEQLMWAKYHYSVAKRLYENFSNYETKRFLTGCLNEMALSATNFVNAFLIYSHVNNGVKIPKKSSTRMRIFEKEGGKILGDDVVKNTFDVFNIRRAQKNSPVELLRGNKILLLDKGEYRALTFERVGGLLNGAGEGLKSFGKI
jgi:hypothetical protein